MTTAIDFDALQASLGPRVTLLGNQDVAVEVVGTDYTDFSVFESVYLDARVQRVNSRAGSLTITVEHSDDGLSWVTAETFTFTYDGEQAALLSSPKAHLRARAVGAGTEWYVKSLTAAPTYLDAADGGGNGGDSSALPVADQTAGPTIDTTTYDDPYTGGGAKLRTLVFPAGPPDFGDAGLFAVAVEGDAFPRILLSSDPSDGWYYGDGTVDPRGGNSMAMILGRNAVDGSLVANFVSYHGDLAVGKADAGGNRGFIDKHTLNLVFGDSEAMIATVFGVPAIGGEVGDMAIRIDGGDGSWIYRCTVAGAAGAATWVAKL